jgi:hypothetical protein
MIVKTWQAWAFYGDPVGHGEMIASSEEFDDILTSIQDEELLSKIKSDEEYRIEIGYWELPQ